MSLARTLASAVGAAGALLAFGALEGELRAPPPPEPAVAQTSTTPKETKQAEDKPEARKQRVDGRTGLILDDGWELVATSCTGCHSSRLVIQNAGDREHWETMIRWMQRTQNLWDFAPEVEERLLDYLANNYGPREYARRPPLDPWLMPPDLDKRLAPKTRPPMR